MKTYQKIQAGILLLSINPILFLKYLKKKVIELLYQIKVFKMPSGIVHRDINGVYFPLDFQKPYIAPPRYLNEMQFGLYEIPVVECMKKFLKQGDIFIDVGANLGYLSAVGASLVGKNGEVHSFEPLPILAQKLEGFAQLNPQYKIIVNNIALGEKEGENIISYIAPPYTAISSMIPTVLPKDIEKEDIKIKVMRLDEYILRRRLKVNLIKIDVEGYEPKVLQGLRRYFQNTANPAPIICEIVPEVYPCLGVSAQELVKYMRKYGYEAYNIYNLRLKVDITRIKEGAPNVVWMAK